MIKFSTPVLYVSPEVVQDLDGEDALYGIWTVFTKCKHLLKDGERLENLAWRLWYRELSLSHSPGAFTSGTSESIPSLSNADFPSALTPVSEDGHRPNPNDFLAVSDDSSEPLLSVPQGPSRHSRHGGGLLAPPTSNTRQLSTASMPAGPGTRLHHQQRVESILTHILPEKAVYPSPTASRRPYSFPKAAPSSNPSTATSSPMQTSAASTYITSSMPKPATSVAQPRPTITMPTFHCPSTPPMLAAPRVVGDNPTPHPTPLATLHPSNSASAAALPPMSATHLSPSPPHLAFFASKAVPVVTMPSSALSSILAPVMANQDQSAPLRAEPSVEEVSRVRRDETLKLLDRHLFLDSSEHLEKALPSPERPQTESPQKSLDLPEPSPASTTSSNVKSEVALAPPRRTQSRTTIRRGKDVPRFTTAKITGKIQRPTMARKQTKSKKPMFNIESAFTDDHGQHLQKASPVKQHHPSQTQHHPKQASLPKKKGTTISTSSDYSAEFDDDSEWASEGNSANEKEKNRQKLESKVRDAGQEAQRQRDMFSKLPKRSYTDLTQRTRSGLLSQLMNPDPSIFPPNHPYRQSHSTTDMTQLTGQHGGQLPPPNYQTRESSAAVPLAAQIPPLNALAPSTNSAAASINAAYRPKGRPQGEELETDTEEEGAENGLQLSTSLVQRKLATLAGPSQRRSQDQQTNGPSGLARFKAPVQRRGTVPSVPVQTAPIPLTHPYNLPAPAPPMTPGTTRRQMLSTELSESMRRNVLWERQVSKVNMLGAVTRGGGVLGQRLQPLTQAHPQDQGQGQVGQPLDEREEQCRAVIARQRFWADDFHYAGW